MVLSGTKCTTSYDPNDGKLIWIMDGPTEQFVASLVYNERAGYLFLTGGFPEHHILAIKPDGTGNVTRHAHRVAHQPGRGLCALTHRRGRLVPRRQRLRASPIASRPRPGRIAWEERMREHHASLVSAEGNVVFINDFGVMRVVKPGNAYALVAESELGEKVFASPAHERRADVRARRQDAACASGRGRRGWRGGECWRFIDAM